MPVGRCRISREQPRGDNLVFSGRIVGKPEVIHVGPIGNDKSASGHQFLRLLLTRAHPAPGRCDR
jgi:hypothetical protein